MEVIDINAKESFFKLKEIRNSNLIDVRSLLEWHSTGIPDLSSINKSVFLFEWEQNINQFFISKFQEMLSTNFERTSVLFFICKSGIRSKIAAHLATISGYYYCYNISDGYYNKGTSNWKNTLPTKKLDIKHH